MKLSINIDLDVSELTSPTLDIIGKAVVSQGGELNTAITLLKKFIKQFESADNHAHQKDIIFSAREFLTRLENYPLTFND